MSQGNKLCVLVLFTCLVVWLCNTINQPVKQEIIYPKEEWRQKRDSLTKQNETLGKRIIFLHHKAKTLQTNLNKQKGTIETIKRKKNEKMDTIDKLDNDELYSFFAKFNAKDTAR